MRDTVYLLGMRVPDGHEAKCASPSLTFPAILRPMLSEQAATHGTCGSLSSYLTETETERENSVKSKLPKTSYLFIDDRPSVVFRVGFAVNKKNKKINTARKESAIRHRG